MRTVAPDGLAPRQPAARAHLSADDPDADHASARRALMPALGPPAHQGIFYHLFGV